MAQKFARYTKDTDADGQEEYPAQLLPVQPGDVVISPTTALPVAANSVPNFTGFVDETGAPWPA